jgi:hypothetical protein
MGGSLLTFADDITGIAALREEGAGFNPALYLSLRRLKTEHQTGECGSVVPF